ncbi:MAG: IspD/TarI family cytidylyltransferase [Thermoanaerobaculia bacterium]
MHAVVPAAGRGLRFGGTLSKQFESIAGRPLLAWTVERLLAAGVDSVTVALPADAAASPPAWLRDSRVRTVTGGDSRQESVAMALAASPAEGSDLVLVHDGARPALADADLLAVCQAAAGAFGAAGVSGASGAVLGRLASDTLKKLEQGEIVGTIDRRQIFRAETPQVFRRRLLEQAVSAAFDCGFIGTDESALIERIPGVRIAAVEAAFPNPKLTTPADVPWIVALLERLQAEAR